ncbi:MAG: SDR family oxidoreductase [Candidatus Altiarchaeota archaeon]|nr:SDR family oxidoreductase [Candidatus Altiarchaeota archaeon]
MKIMVTGGAGFIGSHIVDKLVERGYEVVVVDNLSTGRKENLNQNARFHELDLRSKEDLERVFKENNIRKVIHQAAQASVIKSVREPDFDAEVNIIGTINLLECCRRYDTEKIVYASTGGAIYGEPEHLPMDEEHPIKPLSPYGLGKYVSELYMSLYHRLYGLKCTALRYSNVYGPRQDPHGEAGVIAIFSKKLLEDKQPIIFGDGKQTRDFVYVRDVVEANLLALEGVNGTYNICTGKQTSVNEIFEMLRNITGKKTKAAYEEERKGEVRYCSLNYSKAEKALKWKPKTGIEKGLKETVDYFKGI